jgi:hypothetical protein
VFRPDNERLLQTTAYKAGLRVNGALRGGKHTVWQGGFNVPFIVRWPGRAPAGTVCNEMVSLADVLATTAAIVGEPLPPANKGAEDSFSFLPALRGVNTPPARDHCIVHSADGNFALRRGPWKWIEGEPAVDVKPGARALRGTEYKRQLYNLANDPGETQDLSAAQPAIAKDLAALLDRYRDGGYSRELPPVVPKPPQPAALLPAPEGVVVLREALAAVPGKPWNVTRGNWSARDSAVWGVPARGDTQPADLTCPLDLADGTLQLDLNLRGADRLSLRFQQPGARHSFRVVVSPGQLDIARNPGPGEGVDKAVSLARARLRLKRDAWYSLRVTLRGPEVSAQIHGVTIRGTHPECAERKAEVHLLVFDGDAGLRNVTVVR